MIDAPLIVLDDDPTGTQSMAGVPVVLRLDDRTLQQVADDGAPAVHLMTNSRASTPADVRRDLAEVVARALRAWPDAELVLRGDSTLRGHLLEEYEVVRDARYPGQHPVLLLAPALPAAGRVTVDGVHLLERDGERTPLHDTEYARDPALGYATADLLDWAEERSAGWFPAADGAEIHLDELRRDGAAAVDRRLRELATRGQPAVCAVDAGTDDDLRALVAGYVAARRAGTPVILRCAPTAAGLLSGAAATEPAPMPRGVATLLVCGSFVPTATRQLAALETAYPGLVTEVDVAALTGGGAEAEVDRVTGLLDASLRTGGVAALATPRAGGEGPGGFERQRTVAARLAQIVRSLPTPPDVVVTKGGVTSAVTVRDGLGADRADVEGPVEPGVGRWAVVRPDGSRVTCLVVPGNVGDDELLVRLVAGVTDRHDDAGATA